jgi:hypothetical protein
LRQHGALHFIERYLSAGGKSRTGGGKQFEEFLIET